MAPMINNISLKKDKFLNSILCIMFYILIAICILIFMNINSNNRIYINWDYFERWIILFFFLDHSNSEVFHRYKTFDPCLFIDFIGYVFFSPCGLHTFV